MKISDLLKLSFDNLKRRKSRTILTVLGVVIGTCSIVMMVSIGVALDKSYHDMLGNMGDLTLIEVYNWNSTAQSDPMTDKVIDLYFDGNESKNDMTLKQWIDAGNIVKYIFDIERINYANCKIDKSKENKKLIVGERYALGYKSCDGIEIPRKVYEIHAVIEIFK